MATPIPLELTDDLSTQPVQVITGAQTIYAYNSENHNTYPVFIKFYDKLAVNVNPAVDVPAYKLTVPGATLVGPGRLINDNVTLTFTTAISIRGTVNTADNDTTSPAASPALAIMLDQVVGSSGAVTSVNGLAGVVVLGPSDIGAQPVDPDLTSIAAITTTGFGRGLLALADAAALRTTAGLGTSAVKDIPAAGDATSAQVVFGTDTRLTNSRTPSSHAASHANAGSDQITIAESQVTSLTSDLSAKAPLASPALTGTPIAPTAAGGNNSTQVATTAFVQSALPTTLPPNGAAGGDLSGSFPNPNVDSTAGTPFAPSATIDTTDLGNIPDGTLDIARVTHTRTHQAETSTITLPLGNGIDYDTTATGTLTTIAFSGSPSGAYIVAARLRIVVTGTQTVAIPSSRRLGTSVGTTTSVTLNAGNHELSWISVPSGASSALEYWLADSSDDGRQAFSNVPVTVNPGTRQVAQTGTMSAARAVTLPAATAFPNGNGFWLVDESGTVSSSNKLILTRVGSDTINGASTLDQTIAFSAVFIQSDGVSKWTVNPAGTSASIDNTAFAASWDAVTATAPSKNAVYDALHAFDTDDNGKVNVLDQGAGIANTDASGILQTAISSTGTGNVVKATSPTITSLSVGGDPVGVVFYKRVTGIDMTVLGQTTIYTVPGGKTGLYLGGWVECSAKAGTITTHSIYSFKESGALVNLTNPQTDATASETVGKVNYVGPSTVVDFCKVTTGNSFQFSVNTAMAGGTTLTKDVTIAILIY